MGRHRNLPCDCNAPLYGKGAIDGEHKVRCSKCGHNWRQAEKPPRKRRFDAKPLESTSSINGRKMNEPCDCRAWLINKGTIKPGVWRVQCSRCDHRWTQREQPPRKPYPRKTPLAVPPREPNPTPVVRLPQPRVKQKRIVPGIDVEPEGAAKIDETEIVLAPDVAARYREVRQALREAGRVPELRDYDFAIPE